MQKQFIKILSLIMSVALIAGVATVNASAATASEIRNKISSLQSEANAKQQEINKLKGQIDKQEQLKNAIQEKIAITQQQINVCNSEIAKINAQIAANKAEIDKTNKQIEADKLAFQKRLRAIKTSNTGSNLQVLLGAKNFAQFLQLSQMTASVAAKDKKLIEELTDAIKSLQKKQDENNNLLQQQVDIKKTVTEKQNELQSQNNEIQSVINSINKDKNEAAADKATLDKQIREYNATLNSMLNPPSNYSFKYDGGAFLWPVAGYYSITAGFQSNDSVHRGHHNGIDISGGGIAGKPILAVSDGIVTKSNNSCTHNYKKSGSCGCGGGYGNYVTINHGTGPDGKTYVVTYGHMSSTAVGTGTRVKKGQVIGYVGTTGWSTGYHLHLGFAVNGRWVNPMNYYKKVK